MLINPIGEARVSKQKKELPTFKIEDESYIARLAGSPSEIDEALKLRFEVFNLELGEGLQSSFSTLRDEDLFDKQCDHLIILHKESNRIIGTYRMQTIEAASKGNGFYSASEFNFNNLSNKIKSGAVELGRACINKNFRNKKILFLLWCGIAQYTIAKQKRFLFGCCSLTSQSAAEGIKLYRQLSIGNQLHKQICLSALPGFYIDQTIEIANAHSIVMPPLLGMYLRYGAKVISQPAIDRDFKTIDYLILLDVAELSPAIKRMFFRLENSKEVYSPE